MIVGKQLTGYVPLEDGSSIPMGFSFTFQHLYGIIYKNTNSLLQDGEFYQSLGLVGVDREFVVKKAFREYASSLIRLNRTANLDEMFPETFSEFTRALIQGGSIAVDGEKAIVLARLTPSAYGNVLATLYTHKRSLRNSVIFQDLLSSVETGENPHFFKRVCRYHLYTTDEASNDVTNIGECINSKRARHLSSYERAEFSMYYNRRSFELVWDEVVRDYRESLVWR